jgi:hypothetical protein
VKAYAKSWLDPIGLYIVLVLVVLILEQLDVLPRLAALILVLLATLAMLIANGREKPGLYRKLWHTEGERDEARLALQKARAELMDMRATVPKGTLATPEEQER